ncbi:MAG: hypothetical protein ACQCN3_02655 [Candidatus Bathyarchaeia archaeon]|jgi:hypothetical protein
MPFTEEAPKSVCGCKNRACPFQDFFIDKTKGKKYLKYQCSKPELWTICLRWVDPKSHTPKEEQQPEPAPTPQPQPAPAPAELQEDKTKNRCNVYPQECHLCSPKTQDKCGVEPEHRKPPI